MTSLKQQDQQMIELIQEAQNLNHHKKESVSHVERENKTNGSSFDTKSEETKNDSKSHTVTKNNLENKLHEKKDNDRREQKQLTIDPNKDYFEALRERKSERPTFTYNKKSSTYRKTSFKSFEESKRPDYKRRNLTRRSLQQVSNTIEAHEEKYQAQRAYEIQQRRIQYEQERR